MTLDARHVIEMADEGIYANLNPTTAKVSSQGYRSLSVNDDANIYSNIASSSNPQLVAKTEALLQELEEQAPNLSRDLKLKIVNAILEEEPNSFIEQPQKDSDEGRAIID